MTDEEKQVEEMAKDVTGSIDWCRLEDDFLTVDCFRTAEALYEKGYRKQIDGERIVCGMFDDFLKCSICGDKHPWQTAIEYRFCPNCGAKMKGGERE